MQRWREHYLIDLHQVRQKHIKWARVDAEEGVLKINPLIGQIIWCYYYILKANDCDPTQKFTLGLPTVLFKPHHLSIIMVQISQM